MLTIFIFDIKTVYVKLGITHRGGVNEMDHSSHLFTVEVIQNSVTDSATFVVFSCFLGFFFPKNIYIREFSLLRSSAQQNICKRMAS